MKIIYILPSLNIRGSSVIFEHVNRLADKGHDLVVTSLDDIKSVNHYPLKVVPTAIGDVRKEFEKADVIVAYNPVCALMLNDLDIEAKKYCVLLNDEHEYYLPEYIKIVNKMDDTRLDIEYEKQKSFIEASYNLDMHYFVSNKQLEAELTKRKRKVTLVPTGINHDLFYPEQFVPKKDGVIRLITEGTELPWKRTNIVSRALSELRSFELWTLDGDKASFKTDKHWGNLNAEMLRKVFSSSDIYIDMSISDGIAERSMIAMATGCAVVTAKTSGSEMFCKDGINCIIIDGKTEEEFSENLKLKLEELMHNRELLDTIIRGGLETANSLEWNIDDLEKGLKRK